MGKIRRKFDIQFKVRVCQAIEAGLHTIAEIGDMTKSCGLGPYQAASPTE
jgi:hypothetical protein